MAEYQNIQTRMLGADSFPYRNVTVNQEVRDVMQPFYSALFMVWRLGSVASLPLPHPLSLTPPLFFLFSSNYFICPYPCRKWISIYLYHTAICHHTFLYSFHRLSYLLHCLTSALTSDSSIQVFDLAVDALNHLFFVGLQEEYEVSVKVLLQEFNIEVKTMITKERDTQRSKSQTRSKAGLKKNRRLIERTEIVNSYDMQLYELGMCS